MSLVPWITGTQLATDRRWSTVALPGDVSADDVALSVSQILWARTGRRYNAITETIRPHRLAGDCDGGGSWSEIGGWDGLAAGGGLSVVTEYVLPAKALPGSVSVIVDGAPFSTFAVVDGQVLVRQDGGLWPSCQMLSVPAGRPGTWSVTYTRGSSVPRMGFLAAHELGIEMALSLSGSPTSKLMPRVTETNRNGQALTQATDKYMADGLFGLPVVDAFIQSSNPNRLRRRPGVYSPDMVSGAT